MRRRAGADLLAWVRGGRVGLGREAAVRVRTCPPFPGSDPMCCLSPPRLHLFAAVGRRPGLRFFSFSEFCSADRSMLVRTV